MGELAVDASAGRELFERRAVCLPKRSRPKDGNRLEACQRRSLVGCSTQFAMPPRNNGRLR